MIYPWKHSRRYNAYAAYLKSLFGQRVQKISIHAGFSCPNRDGTLSAGGCSFCDNAAFNPSYCQPQKSIAQQIEEGIAFHRNRYRRANKYLAYFQAYSNTYADLDTLKRIYNQALENENIIGLIIGTRPDCIDEEKLDYFAHLAETKYVLIEYGIESCNDKTLQAINRGHNFEASVKALELTHKMGVRAGAHFIIGLPGETKETWLTWPKIISQLPIHTLKFHQLQIIKNTPMAMHYLKHPKDFHLFELQEYVQFMIEFIEDLHPNIIIERFAGEVPPRYLYVNGWNLIRNYQLLQMIERKLEELNTWQGKFYQE
ncbi:MAG: TIGR01212 family radical SAM protein [Bacteroidales bacterium]